LDPEDVARQLTLVEHSLLARVRPVELINQNWNKHKHLAPNILQLIHRFNWVSLWVATTIVETDDIKLRAIYVSRFIAIAQKCREVRNYNGVMEILTGLDCSAVYRLKRTWKLVPQKFLQSFAELSQLMDSRGNFNNYRTELRAAEKGEPAIPFLARILGDLVFLDEGNYDHMPKNKHMLNYYKFRSMAKIIKDLLTHSNTRYRFDVDPFIHIFVTSYPIIDSQKLLYEISCKREEKIQK